jgi:AraC-like DNA-binding protein/ligand-binding sensor protein
MSRLSKENSLGAADAHERLEIIRALTKSRTYRDFAKSFSQTTGLPLSLTPMEFFQLAHHQHPNENPFCALLAQRSPTCAACLQAQHEVAKLATQTARTIECDYGLYETAVPVRVGEHVLGFVRTGQVFGRAPTSKEFSRILARLSRGGAMPDVAKLRAAYFATRTIPLSQYHSFVGLLKFLAQHLAILSNQIVLRQTLVERPKIVRAKEFIEAHYGEEITLRQVAGAVHTSPFHFCKQFKESTGINFSRYVSNLRVEKAKTLLLNPHYRVSEIAYAVGFSSLTHFNRRFEEITGYCPTAYRRAQFGVGKNEPVRDEKSRNNRTHPLFHLSKIPELNKPICGGHQSVHQIDDKVVQSGNPAVNAGLVPHVHHLADEISATAQIKTGWTGMKVAG